MATLWLAIAGDGHYADVECAYAELKRYLVLIRKKEGRQLAAQVYERKTHRRQGAPQSLHEP